MVEVGDIVHYHEMGTERGNPLAAIVAGLLPKECANLFVIDQLATPRGVLCVPYCDSEVDAPKSAVGCWEVKS